MLKIYLCKNGLYVKTLENANGRIVIERHRHLYEDGDVKLST